MAKTLRRLMDLISMNRDPQKTGSVLQQSKVQRVRSKALHTLLAVLSLVSAVEIRACGYGKVGRQELDSL